MYEYVSVVILNSLFVTIVFCIVPLHSSECYTLNNLKVI
jgi:hypothetical protein